MVVPVHSVAVGVWVPHSTVCVPACCPNAYVTHIQFLRTTAVLSSHHHQLRRRMYNDARWLIGFPVPCADGFMIVP